MEGNNEAAMKEVNTALQYRPSYQEAMQLKERIIGEMSPNEVGKIERNVLKTIGQQ
jgi:hypothetical protein